MDDTDAMSTADETPPAAVKDASTAADTETSKDAASSAGGLTTTQELIEIGKTVVYALLIAAVIRVLLFQPFTIPSASMEPNLQHGDYIIVSKYSYGYSRYSTSPLTIPFVHGRLFDRTPKRGDIVVFKLPRDGHTDYIKRLIGLPGDRIQLKGGVVWLNGKPIPREIMPSTTEVSPYGFAHEVQHYRETLPSGRSYTVADIRPDGDVDDTGVYVVPAKHYFMMGDNRDNSQDSRYPEAIGVGYVPAENLVGRANIILLSWNAKASIFKPWTWILDARPSRFFHILK
jgi:signal peptidase I